jgi:hypothetical protein
MSVTVNEIEAALRQCLECIEIQNMHSWDECDTVEESIKAGNWCQMAIDARAQARKVLELL